MHDSTYSKKQLKTYLEWDWVNWSSAIRYWDKYCSQDYSNSVALEIGARNGGLSLWLAQKGCQTICSDVNGPTENAKNLHRQFNQSNNIQYTEIDATNIPYMDYFDIVVFKSVLGGIGRNDNFDRQQKTIDTIYSSLKSGGELLFAENLIASPIHRFFRKKYVTWAKEWRYVTIKEMERFLNQFRSFNYRVVGFLGAFGRNENQKQLFGFLDRNFFQYVSPKSWRYIIVGVARK